MSATPTAEIVTAALDVAAKHQITGYDACYVALSARLNLPLVTADDRLVNAMSGAGFDVRLLDQLELDT